MQKHSYAKPFWSHKQTLCHSSAFQTPSDTPRHQRVGTLKLKRSCCVTKSRRTGCQACCLPKSHKRLQINVDLGEKEKLRFFSCRRDCRTGASLQEASSAAPPSPSAATQAVNEYTELRQKLLSRAKKGSGFLAGYIFLQQGLVVWLSHQ